MTLQEQIAELRTIVTDIGMALRTIIHVELRKMKSGEDTPTDMNKERWSILMSTDTELQGIVDKLCNPTSNL